jgi:hypothetical protein
MWAAFPQMPLLAVDEAGDDLRPRPRTRLPYQIGTDMLFEQIPAYSSSLVPNDHG